MTYPSYQSGERFLGGSHSAAPRLFASSAIRMPNVAPARIDLSRFVRRGDTVLWSQGAAEPLALSRALMSQRAQIGPITVFCGLSFSGLPAISHTDIVRVAGYGSLGSLAQLAAEDRFDLVPTHMSALPRLMRDGILRVNVLFLHLSPPDAEGFHSLGIGVDLAAEALESARTIVAEVNEQMPVTAGPVRVHTSRLDAVVRTSRDLIEVASSTPSESDREIGRRVARIVPDGATLQIGIGHSPAAVADSLRARRDLTVHSGLITDAVIPLLGGDGSIGRHVTGMAFGTRNLYDFVHQNQDVWFRPVSSTHSVLVLSRLERLFAINGAIEVDLTGQVNAEVIDGVRVGAVGGQADFIRGAALSPGGRSIVAISATARSGTRSRIVPRLGPGSVGISRTDVDMVVTEYGVAELRGSSLRDRARALIRVAHPRFRRSLEDSVSGPAARKRDPDDENGDSSKAPGDPGTEEGGPP